MISANLCQKFARKICGDDDHARTKTKDARSRSKRWGRACTQEATFEGPKESRPQLPTRVKYDSMAVLDNRRVANCDTRN
jgi:hypothetical protein